MLVQYSCFYSLYAISSLNWSAFEVHHKNDLFSQTNDLRVTPLIAKYDFVVEFVFALSFSLFIFLLIISLTSFLCCVLASIAQSQKHSSFFLNFLPWMYLSDFVCFHRNSNCRALSIPIISNTLAHFALTCLLIASSKHFRTSSCLYGRSGSRCVRILTNIPFCLLLSFSSPVENPGQPTLLTST